MEDSHYTKFVSQKISKVRWRPSRSSLQKSDIFITGSWDDVKNTIDAWMVTAAATGTTLFNKNEKEFGGELLKRSHKCSVSAGVGDIAFADCDNILAGLENGNVLLLRYNAVDETLSVQQTLTKLHEVCGVKCSCTGIDTNLSDAVTVGDDGCINVLRIGNEEPLRRIYSSESCPISGVTFIKQSEACTVNKMGQLKIFDLRQPGNDPMRIIVTSEELVPLEAIARHPTRPHILAAGGADGCVTLFDTRKESAPLSKLQIHDMEVWELQFHPSSPDSLFTCSEDGAIRRLDLTREIQDFSDTSQSGCPPVDVVELLNCRNSPVNSIGISDSTLVCGTDSESLCVIENIF